MERWVMSTCWSYKGPGFGPQQPYQSGSQLPIPPVSGHPTPSSDIPRLQAYTWTYERECLTNNKLGMEVHACNCHPHSGHGGQRTGGPQRPWRSCLKSSTTANIPEQANPQKQKADWQFLKGVAGSMYQGLDRLFCSSVIVMLIQCCEHIKVLWVSEL